MTSPPHASFLASLIGLSLLSACAARGPFPSLAPRAVERLDDAAPVPTTTPATDPALAARIAELVGAAHEGNRAFEAAIGDAAGAVSRAGTAGTDGWVAAHQALSRAQAARAPTVNALADLDALAVGAEERGVSAEDRERIAAAVAQVRSLAEAQAERLDSLRGRLSGI